MRTIRTLIVGALLSACAVLAYGAGTVVTTEYTTTSVRRVKFAWTSSAGGAADATTTAYFTGAILGVTTVPGTGGTVPTANYDVAINDDDAVDVLNGTGANKSATLTEHVSASLGVDLGTVVSSKLTLAVTNAGASKTGVVYVDLR